MTTLRTLGPRPDVITTPRITGQHLRAALLAMSEPGPEASARLRFLWKAARWTEEQLDTAIDVLAKSTHLQEATGTTGMSLQAAINTGLLRMERRDGWIMLAPATWPENPDDWPWPPPRV